MCKIIMKTYKFRISIKWYKNDNGGDIRTVCIDYKNKKDKQKQISKILNDFRTKPMNIGKNKGKIPYSVSTTIKDMRK